MILKLSRDTMRVAEGRKATVNAVRCATRSLKTISSVTQKYQSSAMQVVPTMRLSHGEFDPGSGRTLAACLIHASRAVPRKRDSGGRVRNT